MGWALETVGHLCGGFNSHGDIPTKRGWFISWTIYHLVMTNSLPWKDPPIFKNGKPSFSMGHLYHGYVSHNQRVSTDDN